MQSCRKAHVPLLISDWLFIDNWGVGDIQQCGALLQTLPFLHPPSALQFAMQAKEFPGKQVSQGYCGQLSDQKS